MVQLVSQDVAKPFPWSERVVGLSFWRQAWQCQIPGVREGTQRPPSSRKPREPCFASDQDVSKFSQLVIKTTNFHAAYNGAMVTI